MTDREFLESRGYIVGDRDPKMNTAFKGRYMVAEPYPEGHTQEDPNGGYFCIVGDNLAQLITHTVLFVQDMHDEDF